MKKLFLFLLFLMTSTTYSQCAMCKAVVENGDSEMAEGINSGIIYLMLFPYLFLTIGIFFLYKWYKKRQKM